jgi:hypothetical protein
VSLELGSEQRSHRTSCLSFIFPFAKEVRVVMDNKLEANHVSSSTTVRTSVCIMSEVVLKIFNG